MELISRFADAWMPVFLTHMAEVSAFILLVCGADRLLRLGTRLRYALHLLALAKVFVPPLLSLPAPLPEALPARAVLQPILAGLGDVGKAGGSRLSLLLFGAWAGSVLLLTGIVVRQNLAVRRQLRHATPISLPPGVGYQVSGVRYWSLPDTRNLTPETAVVSSPTPDTRHLNPFLAFSCPAISTPTLVGLRRPRLYLPEGWEAWPEGHLRSVLAHEMAHHRARDLYALALQTLAVILFGLNPLVWMLHARLTHLRELRCDEAAIRQTGIRPVDYSRVLFAFVDRQGGPPLPGLTGMSFSESSCTISGRFHHVLNLPPDRGREALWHYAAPILLGLAILPLSCRWEGVFPVSLEGAVVASLPSGTAQPLASAEKAAAPSAKSDPASSSPVTRASKPTAPAVRTERATPPAARRGQPAQPSDPSPSPAMRAEEAIRPTAPGVSAGARLNPAAPEGPPRRTASAPMERPPELVEPLKLTYPEIALQSRTEGEVEVHILVTRTGEVRGVKVVSGPMMLHEAARKAAWDSLWRPAIRNGEPADVWVACPIRFTLR